MPDVKPTRRERATETRRKIIEAASAEFRERGYHGATIASIGKRAGVASQTVYFVFHTKAELISAAIDYAVMGGGDPSGIPQQSEWWAEMEAQKTATAVLRSFVEGAGPVFQRASALSEILRGAALTDEELSRTYQNHETLRREAFAQVVTVAMTKGELRKGLDLDRATDILMTVLSDATYYLFTVERSWEHEKVIQWMSETVPRLLLK